MHGMPEDSSLILGYTVAWYLEEKEEELSLDLPSDFQEKEYQFILEKDGVEYTGMGKISISD